MTGGQDALGEASVVLELAGQSAAGQGVSTDIIEAAAQAYVRALSNAERKVQAVADAAAARAGADADAVTARRRAVPGSITRVRRDAPRRRRTARQHAPRIRRAAYSASPITVSCGFTRTLDGNALASHR